MIGAGNGREPRAEKMLGVGTVVDISASGSPAASSACARLYASWNAAAPSVRVLTSSVKSGDVLIQRGTNHAWSNRSDDYCRIAFVLVEARR